MIAELRRRADEAAQDALRALVKALINTGRWDTYLEARYRAAERLVDMIEATIEAEQVADPQAPDYFGIRMTESEARLMDGNR
jgi:hypothetical protein